MRVKVTYAVGGEDGRFMSGIKIKGSGSLLVFDALLSSTLEVLETLGIRLFRSAPNRLR
jgi:hypothetical protein